jgi:hypothetical protein
MRTIAIRVLALSGAAVLAFAAHDVASAEGVGGTSDGGWIAYAVSVAGHVSSVDGGAFRIDGVALALPGEGDRLPINHLRTSDDRVNYDQYQFAQGDLVTVVGSLRADGSILVLSFEEPRSGDHSAETPLPNAGGGLVMTRFDANDRYNAGLRFTSGVVASVGTEDVDGTARPVSFVLDGVTYRIDPDQTGLDDFYVKNERHAVNADGSPVVFDRIAAGDAVLVDWTVEEADGSRDAARISIRQAGVGSDGVGAVLCGTVTSFWGGGYDFAIDGVPVAANDNLFRTDYEDGEDPYLQGAVTHYVDGRYWDRNIPYSFSGVQVGMHVRVDGMLRDGRVFADRVILVIENADSLKAKRAAKRAGRLRAKGMLTMGGDGVMRLSGLPVTLPRRASRALVKRAAAAAARPVLVEARVVGGELVATKIARR